MAQKMAVLGLRHQRSRIAGKIAILNEANRQNVLRLERIQALIVKNNTEIAKLEYEIATMGDAAEIGFDSKLEPPIPRRTVPKHHFAAWGAITRQVLDQLRAAAGQPLNTGELAILITKALELDLSSQQVAKLKVQVRHTLRRLHQNKHVARVSRAEDVGQFSTWVLADFAK